MFKNKLNLRNVFAIAICLAATAMFSACDKDEEAQVVTNACNESDITEATAMVSANITKAGIPSYTERGICWSTHSNPTFSDKKLRATDSQPGSYSYPITGLTANTTYYVKAYVIQNEAIIYANEISFKTKESTEPQIRALLVKLYNDTNGNGWTSKANWLSDKPINEWYGITYSPQNLQIDLEGNNLIGTIDMSGCTALTKLWCENNQLTSLNMSGCTALPKLWCENNRLTSLNVSGCSALKELICNNNLLTNLNVSGCLKLEGLGCSNNQLTTTALNTVFGMLPVVTTGGIYVRDNPGTATCSTIIARNKGWTVYL